jgi:hypothetical protein
MGRPRNGLAQALKRTQKAGVGRGNKHGAVGQGPEQVDSEKEIAEGSGVGTADVWKEFGNLDKRQELILSRFHELEVVLRNKTAGASVVFDHPSTDKVNRSLQIEGLVSLCQQRVDRAANYYRVFSLLMFMLLFFGTVCLQMQT